MYSNQVSTHAATQSTQTLEDDEDDDQYSTPLLRSRPSSGHYGHRLPPLTPELIAKLRRVAKKRSTSQSQQQAIAVLLELYLEQMSPVLSPGESEREEDGASSTASATARYAHVCVCVDTHIVVYMYMCIHIQRTQVCWLIRALCFTC